MNLDEFYGPIRAELELVEKSLAELSRSADRPISEALSDMLNAGGKRLRPALLLTAANACGYSGERAIRLAVAVELIHTASLIHDDVIDNGNLRRGVPTINARCGTRISVLLGDHLYAKVVALLAEDGNLEVIRSVAVAAGKMTDGELRQTVCRNDVSMTEEKYLSIITGKTAALISCSCRVGAMLGENRNGETDILADYGLNLGMAFQITDDLLDLTGEEKKLGKPVGNDIREGRLTLPFIHAIGAAKKEEGQWMKDVFRTGQISGSSLARIKSMVRECGGIQYSLDKARQYGSACKERLKSLKESQPRNALALLADYVVARAN